MDNNYFSRTMVFLEQGDNIVLVDPNSPTLITLDPWLEIIYLLADGQKTIQQTIQELAQGYPQGAPASLQDTVMDVITKLQQAGAISLSSNPQKLPYYLSIPKNQQDQEKAKLLMEQDGYIKN